VIPPGDSPTAKRLDRRVMSMRAPAGADIEERAVFGVMRDFAARLRALAADARRYEQELAELVCSFDRTLLDEPGIGPISAAKLLACDPARFRHEAAFARRNGTAPLPASSGKTVRHRLSRGGDREVNNAIHTIALIRAKHQPETRAYLERRISEGNTKREAMGALKATSPTAACGTRAAGGSRRLDARALRDPRQRPLQTARRGPLDFMEASSTGSASGDHWCGDRPSLRRTRTSRDSGRPLPRGCSRGACGGC